MLHLLHKKYSAIRMLFQYKFFINLITVVLSTMQFKNINNFGANAFFSHISKTNNIFNVSNIFWFLMKVG